MVRFELKTHVCFTNIMLKCIITSFGSVNYLKERVYNYGQRHEEEDENKGKEHAMSRSSF